MYGCQSRCAVYFVVKETITMPFLSTLKLHYTYKKFLVALLAGIVAGVMMALFGYQKYAPLGGWDIAMAVYIVWVFCTIWRMDSTKTKTHAVREDPGRAITDVLLLIASVASLVAVLALLLHASRAAGGQKVIDIALGLGSIVVSWVLVHTTYALNYARLFYRKAGGAVDFNEKALPQYSDFLYLSFTLGMTYQVSDTNLMTKQIRATALKHALLSFLFGTVIIATTINTLASLSQ